ncbi:hypothetical protein [Paenibacillus wulumuqiensis]|uniref:hypothetical protein n=1 Tax=Paenibacillus wulumuqiensis TaxID=1567107 RepID=UPI000619B6CA|nr:hypothetical protein [Paenibacillus wulumuqiensis]
MKNQDLISIVSQKDLTAKLEGAQPQEFIRLHIDKAVASGLVANMGTKLWATLSVIAMFTNEKGQSQCSQKQIAKALGVSQTTAKRYLCALTNYRWKGEPILKVEKAPDCGCEDMSLYTILSF